MAVDIHTEIWCMPVDPKVQALYDRWLTFRSQGVSLTAEEICHDCQSSAMAFAI